MIRRVAAAAMLMVLIAACNPSAPAVADKAGGVGTPVVLRLGTDDFVSAVSARPIEIYKEEVERASGGFVKIEPVYEAAGEVADRWDQRVAEAVQKGDLDLALVPTRAFDELGVRSFQALQAPFLLDDDDLVDRLVTGDWVTELMSGLPAIGISGLALWPDNLRHPVSYGKPITSLHDFRNVTIRAPLSQASYALLEALGSKPVDLNDSALEAALADGSVGAVESTIAGAQGTRPPSVVTANITFFPKIGALVANATAFGRLPEEQRRVLRDAAATTTARLVKTRIREAAAAAELCANGGGLALAPPANVAEIEAAAAPLYAELEKDALTKGLIADFRELRAASGGLAVGLTPCTPAPVPSIDVAAGDQSVLDGIYRYEVTEEYLIKQGVDQAEARNDWGVHTFTMSAGTFSDAWTNSAAGTHSCEGIFKIEGRIVTFTWTRGCFGDVRAEYTLSGDQIQWSNVQALPPHDSATDQTNAEAFQSVPYTRIGDAP